MRCLICVSLRDAETLEIAIPREKILKVSSTGD